MEGLMLGTLRFLGASTVAALSLGAMAAPAQAFVDIPLYSYEYYSDSTYTTMVGYAGGVCYSNYAGTGPLQGSGSQYVIATQVGVCRNGMAIYI
jgi:hypothetical protein